MVEPHLQEPLLRSSDSCHQHPHMNQGPSKSASSHPSHDQRLPYPQLAFKPEAGRVLALALPITASQVLGFLAHLITTAQVGHLGSTQLSALTLGRTIYHITGLSLITGLSSGVSTLGGQAYGAGHAPLVAAVTQRAMAINLALAVGVVAAWTRLPALMALLQQDPAISELSVSFVQQLSPTLFMQALMSCLHTHLTCQGIVQPLTVVAALCTIITPGVNHLFIRVLGLKLDGVAMAQNAVTCVELLLVIAIVYWVDPTNTPGARHTQSIEQQQHQNHDDSQDLLQHRNQKGGTSYDVEAKTSGHDRSHPHPHPPTHDPHPYCQICDTPTSQAAHQAGHPRGPGAPRPYAQEPLRTSGRHWTWSVSTILSARGCVQYLRVAIPSLAMICADWWCFEAMILVAGLQPDAGTQLAVMGILFYTHTLVFFFNVGFSGAAATRCSNLLGAGAATQARYTMSVCLLLASATSAACAAALFLARAPWATLFSSDDKVLAATVGALPWMALSLVGDGCNSVFSGVLEGAGRQALGFGANLVAFWMVGLPLAAWWGRDGGARAMWMAMALVSGLQAAVLGLAVLSFDWHKEAQRASHNVQQGHMLLSSTAVGFGDQGQAHGDACRGSECEGDAA